MNASSFDLKAALKAGLFAGLIFLVLEMILVPLFLGGSPWGPPHMIGAIVLGKGALPSPPPPPGFDGTVVVALVVHFVLSVVFAVVLGFVLTRFEMGTALLVGAVFGLVLYFVNFYGFTAVFPWFAMARNGVSIFTHVVFGVLAAWAYKAWAVPPVAAREPR